MPAFLVPGFPPPPPPPPAPAATAAALQLEVRQMTIDLPVGTTLADVRQELSCYCVPRGYGAG